MKKISIFVLFLCATSSFCLAGYDLTSGVNSSNAYYKVNYNNMNANPNTDYYTNYGVESSNTDYYSKYQNKSYKKNDVKKSVSKQSGDDKFFITPSYVME